MQGYFFSKPVPLEVYRDLVGKGFSETPLPVHLGPEDTVDMMTMSAQLTVLFNGAGGAIGLYELVGGTLEILRANDGYFKLFGDSRDNVYGPDSSTIDRIDYRDRERFWQTIRQAEASKSVEECELRRYCADGRLLWIRVRASIIYVEQLRTLLYLVMEDVTPLAEEREQLQKMLERLRAINPQEVAALEQEFHKLS
ncbi:PAS domain S-box-containing protein [Selenomonas ruminantium]|uniref:PAS domain S-box-containing protein n=1 Tax=Selenomonas ruminantium TaxID=971 RepID=A0A1I3HFM5_SELRU|nr:PAS domain-containing protein [Selenomonas ruminantium]SFI34350.1 PAS domain S-box-containing protein [Selenomonas ruminantium]